MYNMIFGRRKTFEVNSAENTYKVHYLGNVMTSHLKGTYNFISPTLESSLNLNRLLNDEDEFDFNPTQQIVLSSIDKPVKILWDNHLKNNGHAGIKMKLTLTQGGLRVDTKDHGLTEYFGHRIYLVKSHTIHPKLLVWVYQHVGKNLKTEIRCHAALCQNAKHAKTIESLLNEKLKQTFREYKREKRRLQNSRLCNSKNGGLLQTQLGNRKRTFRNITHNYKPPVQHGMCSAPKLDDVLEEDEDEEAEESIIKNDAIKEESIGMQEQNAEQIDIEIGEDESGVIDLTYDDQCITSIEAKTINYTNSSHVLVEAAKNFFFDDENYQELNITKTTCSINTQQYDNRPVTQQLMLSSSSSSSISSDSPSPISSSSNTPEQTHNLLYNECMPANSNQLPNKVFTEVSYDFLSDLSKPIEVKKLNHSKSFITKQQQNFINPFRRTNFSKSFTAFTSRFKSSHSSSSSSTSSSSSNQSSQDKDDDSKQKQYFDDLDDETDTVDYERDECSDYGESTNQEVIKQVKYFKGNNELQQLEKFNELTLNNNESTSSSSSLSSPALSTCSNSSSTASSSASTSSMPNNKNLIISL